MDDEPSIEFLRDALRALVSQTIDAASEHFRRAEACLSAGRQREAAAELRSADMLATNAHAVAASSKLASLGVPLDDLRRRARDLRAQIAPLLRHARDQND